MNEGIHERIIQNPVVVAPFRELQANAAGDGGVVFGAYDTILINTPHLLTALHNYALSAADGPVVKVYSGDQYALKDYAGLIKIDADIVINCTGIAGSILGGPGDLGSMGGVYGVLAKLPCLPLQFVMGEQRYLYSGFGYMFPRSDGTIIGGSWDTSGDRALPSRAASDLQAASGAAQAAYMSSLLTVTDFDNVRARLLVKALGLFFLGRASELQSLKPDVSDWINGAQYFDCATNRTLCDT